MAQLRGRLLWHALACLALSPGCTQSSGWAEIELRSASRGDALILPSEVVSVRITVRGPGMDELLREIKLGTAAEEQVRVDGIPAGQARVIAVTGLAVDGWPVFHGESDPFTVAANQLTALVIVAIPAPGVILPGGTASKSEGALGLLLDSGVEATRSASVSLTLVASTAVEMAVFNELPSPETGCQDYAWRPYDAQSFAWQIKGLAGPNTVYAYVRDAHGYCSRPVSASIVYDTVGPVVDQLALVVDNAPRGINDELAGGAGCTEAGALVEVFSDSTLAMRVASTVAEADGAFAAMSLGDNYGDPLAGVVVGTGVYWVRATDGLGNSGPTVEVRLDVAWPGLVNRQKLAITNNPPGFSDTVSGASNCAEPSSVIEVASDESFSDIVAAGAVGADGAFAAVSCGDNWSNAAQGDAHGQDTYWLRARDAYGNAGIAIPVKLDVEGPRLSANLVRVIDAPPAEDDTLRGVPDSVDEPRADIVVYRDAQLTVEQAAGQAEVDGSFAPLSLGDNFTNQATGQSSGQGTYWVQPFDAYGNGGLAVSVAVDVAPPNVYFLPHPRTRYGYGQIVTLKVGLVDAVNDALAETPSLTLEWAGKTDDLHDGEIPDCPIYDARTMAYTCSFVTCEVTGDGYCDSAVTTFEDATETFPVVTAVKYRSGNVAKVVGPPLRFRLFETPAAPNAGLIHVDMRPPGQQDAIRADANALDESATLVMWTETQAVVCCPMQNVVIYNELAPRITAEANGAIAGTAVGDNAWDDVFARQIDSYGNDPCPEGSAWSCPKIHLYNDTAPPSLVLGSHPGELSFTSSALFSLLASEQGPVASVLSEPVTKYCRVDDQAFASCDGEVSQTLALGWHTFEYYAQDAVANASTVQRYTWHVLPDLSVSDARRFVPLSRRGYVVDSNGMGHFFVAGDKLYHYYENPRGTFTMEVMHAEPVAAVEAVRDADDVLTVVFLSYGYSDGQQDHGYATLRAARGGLNAWTIATVADPTIDYADSFDVELAPDGYPRVLLSHCPGGNGGGARDCFYDGAYELHLSAFDGSVWSPWRDVQIAGSASFAFSPRLVRDASQLWIGFARQHVYYDLGYPFNRRQLSTGGPPPDVPGSEDARASVERPVVWLGAAESR